MVTPKGARGVSGLAISTTAVAAMPPAGGGVALRRELSPPDGVSWPSLAQTLRDWMAAGTIASPVRIALLPPLVEMRTVALPPIGDEDARRLLVRAASRHFLSAREPLLVGVAPARAGGVRLAAAVAARTWRAVLDAARDAGVEVELIVPAQAALARRSSRGANAAGALLVSYGDSVELLATAGGSLTDVRRFRANGDEQAIADAVPAGSTPVRLADPLEAAAEMVAHADGPDAMAFVDPQSGTTSAPAADRRSWWMLGTAAMLAVGTVAMQELDVHRELRAVREERAALAPRLQPGLSSAGGVREEVNAALASPRWSRIVAAIGEALPADAYVTHLRAAADTVIIEGSAVRATAAFDALASASWVGAIVASAPIRREVADDGSVSEKFTFTITMAAR